MCLFQLPTTIYQITSAKYEPAVNKTIIFKKFQKKVTFIKTFINSILRDNFNNTNLHTINNLYIQKTEEYKSDLNNLMQTLPTERRDSTMSVDEIMQLIEIHKKSKIDIFQQKSTIQPFETKFNRSKLMFYPNNQKFNNV